MYKDRREIYLPLHGQWRHPSNRTSKLTLEEQEGSRPAESQGKGIPARGNYASNILEVGRTLASWRDRRAGRVASESEGRKKVLGSRSGPAPRSLTGRAWGAGLCSRDMGRHWEMLSRGRTWSFKHFVINFLAPPCSLWDLSSLIRDWTHALGNERARILTTDPPRNCPIDVLSSLVWETGSDKEKNESDFACVWQIKSHGKLLPK